MQRHKERIKRNSSFIHDLWPVRSESVHNTATSCLYNHLFRDHFSIKQMLIMVCWCQVWAKDQIRSSTSCWFSDITWEVDKMRSRLYPNVVFTQAEKVFLKSFFIYAARRMEKSGGKAATGDISYCSSVVSPVLAVKDLKKSTWLTLPVCCTQECENKGEIQSDTRTSAPRLGIKLKHQLNTYREVCPSFSEPRAQVEILLQVN